MALREILIEPNKILREKSLKVEQVDKGLQTLMDDVGDYVCGSWNWFGCNTGWSA